MDILAVETLVPNLQPRVERADCRKILDREADGLRGRGKATVAVYPFRQLQPGEKFKLNVEDVRSAQKMAWYYRTRCKRPINIVIAKSNDGYRCQRVD